MKSIRMYNLYPRLVGKIEDWNSHALRAKEMGFNAIYINPIAAPGFSGSSYAIKDFYLYHPMFIHGWPLADDSYSDENLKKDKKIGDKLVKDFVKFCDDLGIEVMIDLVINHTAIDSSLITEHPSWYKKDKDGNIKNPGVMEHGVEIKWGDLASIDNMNSKDREALWAYWLKLLNHYLDLGIKGFRCDAAYKVPNQLWEYLIKNTKKRNKKVFFLAETLGCTPIELMAVADTGFDIVMNSFKWWNYKDSWFLADYEQWSGKYSSLTFPENHDTPRFATEYGLNREKALATYALQSYFCSSIGITIGFEFGFMKKIDVVTTTPDDMETGNYDLSLEISEINSLKKKLKVLQEDNNIERLHLGNDIFSFKKESLDKSETILVIANIDNNNWANVNINNFHSLFNGLEIKDLSLGHKMEKVPNNLEYSLKPNEVKLFYSIKA